MYITRRRYDVWTCFYGLPFLRVINHIIIFWIALRGSLVRSFRRIRSNNSHVQCRIIRIFFWYLKRKVFKKYSWLALEYHRWDPKKSTMVFETGMWRVISEILRWEDWNTTKNSLRSLVIWTKLTGKCRLMLPCTIYNLSLCKTSYK